MSEAAFLEMMVLSSTAAGLVLLGAVRALVAGRSVGLRLAATAGCALAPAVGLATVGFPSAAALPAGLVGVLGIGLALVGSGPAAWASARLRPLARPGVQAAALAVGGGVLLVGSFARFEMAEQAVADADAAFMDEVTWKPPLREAAGQVAGTDAGRPVTLWEPLTVRPGPATAAAERRALDPPTNIGRMIRTGPADDTSNCHGWVFTGGRYWLTPEGVEAILADNGYRPVSDPHAGDLAIYRSAGSIAHTAVVRSVAGGLVLLEGKWGWMGVFLHAPQNSPYGQEYAYYRSARDGHLLAGLGGPSASPGRGSADAATVAGH
jgi:hypothetical protein